MTNGQYMAYGLQTSGSDWVEWHVKDVATGLDLPDHLKWSKFSGASWTKDDKGFFYSRYDAPNEKTQLEDANYFHKLYYHVVGEEQAKDTLVYERPDQKEWLFGGNVTFDGKYLIIDVSQGTERKNRVFYRSLDEGLTAHRSSSCCGMRMRTTTLSATTAPPSILSPIRGAAGPAGLHRHHQSRPPGVARDRAGSR